MSEQRPRRRMGGMGHGPMGAMGGEKAKDFKGSFSKLMKYLKPHYIVMLVVLIASIASTVFSIISPKILGNATTDIYTFYVGKMAYDTVAQSAENAVTTFEDGRRGISMTAIMAALMPNGTAEESSVSDNPMFSQEDIKQDENGNLVIKDMLTFEKVGNDFVLYEPQMNFDSIYRIAITLLIIYVISSVFIYIQGLAVAGVSQKVSYQLRKDISEKINRIPLKYYDTKTHGEILSRITNDVDTVSQSLQQSLTQIISSVVTIVGIVVMMLSISPLMTLIAIASLPVTLILVTIIVKLSQKHFKGQQSSLGDINGHVEEMYGGHIIVKAFNMEERSIAKFKETNEALYKSSWKANFISGLMMPIVGFVGNLGYVAVCIVGGNLVISNTIAVGDIQAFIQYIRSFNQPISQTANIANLLQSTMAASERVFEFLEEEEEVPEAENPVKLDKVQGYVTIKNMSFGYTPDKMILKNANIEVKPGQKIAIVGPTGAGKTTLINLLMRFYDVNEGSIEIDGVDIRNMKRSDLRDIFGMVLQDTWLFNDTIRANLKYGNENCTEEEMIQGAKSAHADHYIRVHPDGYDMVINEESNNISQGQKQLLTIARAFLSNPQILILDEATSSVDTRTEIRIQKAMNNLMKNRTSFIIAHRLSTIRDADLILVMKDGNIIESGTHAELMAQNGFYEQLYNSQFENSEAV